MKGNPLVRIYRPVYNAYKYAAQENEVSLSDLISRILWRVAREDLSIVKVVFAEDFRMEYNDAWDAARDLEDAMIEEENRLWEEIQKKMKEMEAGEKAEVVKDG